METVWWIIKQIWQKGLLYKDYKVVPYCPRCGTSLSSHEVALGYEKIKEPAIYVKFKILDPKFENTYLLVWTTTPWTLPGNVAIAINPKFTYAKLKIKEEYLILAKDRIKESGIEGEIINEFSGDNLVGLSYEPLYKFTETDKKAWFIISGDFVSIEEGTGLVHIAPAFGEEDMEVGKKNNLPVLLTVDEEGKFKLEIKKWAGMFVKETDPLIIKDLEDRNLFFKKELYEHDYPFCWRCNSPLLYYAKESWFINMQKVKKDLIINNQKINWIPDYLKEGRFGEWLKEIKDWALSRERYWGTPLPIWQCNKCNEKICIGSIEELNQKSKTKINDLHRPYIDEIKFKCQKCNGEMQRIPEVIDCWFDSGSMPLAQYHYPFENKNFIEKKEQFPADYISEAVDQTRGWFYTLHAISTLLGKGPVYKNVISLGHVLDEKGEKMSKSKGNVADPWEVIEKYGADATRWYFYTINQPGDAKLFSEKDIDGCLKRFIMILWNCLVFYETYTQKSKFQIPNSKHILDKWILSKLNGSIKTTTESLDKYDITLAGRIIERFIVDDLSQWYIRRSRLRFQKPKTQQELEEVSNTLNFLLLNISRTLAPFSPFLAEEIYQKLKTENMSESIHLYEWPKADKKLINKELEEKMKRARDIVTEALAQRAKHGIKVRQPLPRLKVKSKKLDEELIDLLKEEINIKEIVFDEKLEKEIELDAEITPELKEEGIFREYVRNTNELRKTQGFSPTDEVIGVTGSAFPSFYDEEYKKKALVISKETMKIEEAEAKGFRIKKIIIDNKEDFVGIKRAEKRSNKNYI
jgi:isoleucyl-tRNA synthetase